jgi:hypothetical protein
MRCVERAAVLQCVAMRLGAMPIGAVRYETRRWRYEPVKCGTPSSTRHSYRLQPPQALAVAVPHAP